MVSNVKTNAQQVLFGVQARDKYASQQQGQWARTMLISAVITHSGWTDHVDGTIEQMDC